MLKCTGITYELFFVVFQSHAHTHAHTQTRITACNICMSSTEHSSETVFGLSPINTYSDSVVLVNPIEAGDARAEYALIVLYWSIP